MDRQVRIEGMLSAIAIILILICAGSFVWLILGQLGK